MDDVRMMCDRVTGVAIQANSSMLNTLKGACNDDDGGGGGGSNSSDRWYMEERRVASWQDTISSNCWIPSDDGGGQRRRRRQRRRVRGSSSGSDRWTNKADDSYGQQEKREVQNMVMEMKWLWSIQNTFQLRNFSWLIDDTLRKFWLNFAILIDSTVSNYLLKKVGWK